MAHRDPIEPRYDLIPWSVLRRIALTFAEGAKHYGDRNWEKGLPYSVMINHTLEHLAKYQQGDRSEDHLAKACFGLIAMMFYDEHHFENDWTEKWPMEERIDACTGLNLKLKPEDLQAKGLEQTLKDSLAAQGHDA